MKFDKEDTILIYAGGGGGDIASAGFLYMKMSRLVRSVYLAALPWERYVVDPKPGPIRSKDLRNVSRLGDYSYIVYKDSYAVRDGRKIIFQAVNISNTLMAPVYIVTGEAGVEGIYRGLKEIIEYLNPTYVIGLDVGGDILAVGTEENLWSPLADQMSLAAIYRVDRDGVNTMIGVSSPGSDGELSSKYVLDRIRSIMKRGGLYGIIGYGYDDLTYINRILDNVYTEAGAGVKYALEGFIGERSIRSGTRKIDIDVYTTMVFLLKTELVYKDSLLAREIIHTSSIEEADDILARKGVASEYMLEKELNKLSNQGIEIDSNIILSVWKGIRDRIRSLKKFI